MTAYQVICWSSIIKAENRNSRNMSDGAIFGGPRGVIEANKFAKGIIGSGGGFHSIKKIENATHWFESVEEYNRAGLMSFDELNAIANRGKTFSGQA